MTEVEKPGEGEDPAAQDPGGDGALKPSAVPGAGGGDPNEPEPKAAEPEEDNKDEDELVRLRRELAESQEIVEAFLLAQEADGEPPAVAPAPAFGAPAPPQPLIAQAPQPPTGRRPQVEPGEDDEFRKLRDAVAKQAAADPTSKALLALADAVDAKMQALNDAVELASIQDPLKRKYVKLFMDSGDYRTVAAAEMALEGWLFSKMQANGGLPKPGEKPVDKKASARERVKEFLARRKRASTTPGGADPPNGAPRPRPSPAGFEAMTEREFNNRHDALIAAGKTKEADQLEERFLSGQIRVKGVRR